MTSRVPLVSSPTAFTPSKAIFTRFWSTTTHLQPAATARTWMENASLPGSTLVVFPGQERLSLP